MPSKKRKYNARFPAGRIKKIMQTDEEVGKVAQAVPIIISRTLELFVESLLNKALQVTMSRNAKTLSPSHVKQCILAESKFDFLRDLVKNIPDVSVAEEKELQMSAESSPTNSSRLSEPSAPRRIAREDSNSSSSCDIRMLPLPREPLPRESTKRALSADVEAKPKIETVTSATTDAAIDLSVGSNQIRFANFYQETLVDPVQHKSVITLNPTYSCPQPSTSNYAPLTPVEPIVKPDAPKQIKPLYFVDVRQNNVTMTPPRTPVPPILNIDFTKNMAKPEIKTPVTPLLNLDFTKNMAKPEIKTPVTPILNIDFTKNIANPEIKVLDTSVVNVVKDKIKEKLQRQNSKGKVSEPRRAPKPPPPPINIDNINSGNLQIDEDYDT